MWASVRQTEKRIQIPTMKVQVQCAVLTLALLCVELLVPVAHALSCHQCTDIPKGASSTTVQKITSLVTKMIPGSSSVPTDVKCSDPKHPGKSLPAAHVCQGAAFGGCANITKGTIVVRFCSLKSPHIGCKSVSDTKTCFCLKDNCNGVQQTGGGAGPVSLPALALLLAALATTAVALS